MTLGQRISEYRKGLGISQEELGARLGVSRQAVSKWETDIASPDMENLLALSREFGISVAELTATPEETPAPPEASAPEPFQKRGGFPWKGLSIALLLCLVVLGVLWCNSGRNAGQLPPSSTRRTPRGRRRTLPSSLNGRRQKSSWPWASSRGTTPSAPPSTSRVGRA